MNNDNPLLQLADEFVRDTGCNIFLTGKAGTGKTTFLHTIKKQSPKRMIVTAPTGVAAINAGGVTLHSFFQMPFGPFVPGSEGENRHKFSRDKINLIKSLDLLVIDEISMVRADLLDGVDSVLRRHRRSNLPFGGVQLLLIGDLHQLSPVVKDAEWRLLQPYYDSPYFFSSNALRGTELIAIELQHIYRQADHKFIDLLNRVRDNKLGGDTLQELNRRHVEGFIDHDNQGYITLCTHNSSADAINHARLAGLSQKTHRFAAEIEGEFPEHSYPTAETLELKTAAQVMFVRNDPSPEKRFFNGKIGKITRIEGKKIFIQCSDDAEEIVVEPTTWENIEYSLNEETLAISEKKIGAFIQYPLKLAWAITIHKSQGLTFDRAIIDAQAAFAHGQVYVALSRCRTLEGIVLSSPLAARAVRTDAAVLRFVAQAGENTPSAAQLRAAKIRYQQRLLLECFDFQRLQSLLARLISTVERSGELVRIQGAGNLRDLQAQTVNDICSVGANFRNQLQGMFTDLTPPTEDGAICERLQKASAYFQEKFATGIGEVVGSFTVETDNKEIRKKAKDLCKWLQEETAVKLAAVRCCQSGFSSAEYLKAISAAEIDTKPKREKKETPTYSEADVGHPELFLALKEWRSQKAKAENVPHYQVLHQKTLIQIAVNLPDTLPALTKLKGIGKKLAEKYGEELVTLVAGYRDKNDIKEVFLPTKPVTEPEDLKESDQPKTPKGPKIATRLLTLELFNQGLAIPQIAEKRGFVFTTIESHLAQCLELGEIPIDRLISPEKRQSLEHIILPLEEKQLGRIKETVGESYTYGEIKYVLAWLRHKAPKS
ncbi:MAG: helix-turn-helix domain-containing protein [Proteobacteria bacterium]|nr:helix-turn-helix domain-containing protein [Pseudomonadota bacterium]